MIDQIVKNFNLDGANFISPCVGQKINKIKLRCNLLKTAKNGKPNLGLLVLQGLIRVPS